MKSLQKVDLGGWKASTCVERLKTSDSPTGREFNELLEFVGVKLAAHKEFLESKTDELNPKEAIKRLRLEIETGAVTEAVNMPKIQRLALAGEQIAFQARTAVLNQGEIVFQAAADLANVALTGIAAERAVDLDAEQKIFAAVGIPHTATELTRRWDSLAARISSALSYHQSPAGEAVRKSPSPNPCATLLEAIGV